MNVSGVNFNRTEETTVSIHMNEGKKQAENKVSEKVFADVVIGKGAMTSTTMDKAQGKALLGELDSVKEQLQLSAQTAKDSLKALFKKMDGSGVVKLDEDGYNLNDMEPEEIVTVVERIQIMLAAYCEDYKGSISCVDEEKIEAVTNGAVSAAAVQEKFREVGIADTQENVKEVQEALCQAEEIQCPNENARLYLVGNDLPCTLDNLFKARYAGEMKSRPLSGEQWEALVPQIQTVIEDAGMEVNDKTMGYARSFLEKDIAVTPEHLQAMEALDNLDLEKELGDTQELLDKIARQMVTGGHAKDMPVGRTPVLTQVQDILATLENAQYREVAAGVALEKSFTVAELKEACFGNGADYTQWFAGIQKASGEELQEKLTDGQQEQASQRYYQLEEIRMLMTAQSGARLIREGLNVAEMPIGQVIDELKIRDAQVMNYDDSHQAEQVYQVRQALYTLSHTSVNVIGAMMETEGGMLTLGQASASAYHVKMRFTAARDTYEAVGTQVRKDLKDSLMKAVEASSESLLKDMNMEDNEANRTAIKILSANRMEVNEANVQQVKELYASVNRLIENMNPQTVLSMIRQGMNPMETEISVLNQYLEAQPEGGANEKYSRFLYKLDKNKAITQEERVRFIGVYKMMNIFKKDAGRAVGALMSQKAQLNMSNLIAAYNARKAAGKDVRIDDATGLAEVEGAVRYFDNLFSASAEKITPDSLKTAEKEKPLEQRSIENFCEAVTQAYDPAVEAERMEGYADELRRRAAADERNLEQLLGSGQPATLDNLMAMQEIMSQAFLSSPAARTLIKSEKSQEFKEEELIRNYENAAQESEKHLEEAVSRQDIRYDDLERLRMQNREIHLLSSLARRHDYRIPYEENGQIGLIHLQVVDGEEKGKAAVRVTHPSGRESMVEITLQNKTLRLYGRDTQDEEGMSAALEKVSASKTVAKLQLEEIKINTGISQTLPLLKLDTQEGAVSTRVLFDISREIIKALGAGR